MTAIIETTSIAAQREKDAAGDSPSVTRRLSSGSASIRPNRSPNPPNRTQVT